MKFANAAQAALPPSPPWGPTRRAGSPRAAAALVLTVGLLGAVVLGGVALTAQPLLVAAVLALMLAPVMLVFPAANLWVLLAGGLLVTGLLPIWAEGAAARAGWAVSGLGFVLLVRALTERLVTAPRAEPSPAFVWLALAWLAYCVLNSLLQYSTFYELASGIKRYFQAWGILFALAWLPFARASVSRWLAFMVVVALLQLPWAAYQRISLVPLREGLQVFYPGMVPADVVAGTFGSPRLGGGANAEMATFLLIVAAFLVARWRAGLLGGGRLLLLLAPCLAPLFLGETKVVVVLMPLLLLFLFRRELLRRPVFALAGLGAGVVLTLGAASAYLAFSDKSLDRQLYETQQYNFRDVGYGNLYLNRRTTLTFWYERQRWDDPAPILIGRGLGTAHAQTGGTLARKYPGYGIDLTAASTLLWEQGVIGVALLLSVLGAAWHCAGRLARRGAAFVRADATAIQATLPVLVVYLFYRSTPIDLLTFQIVIAGLLGYLAWLHRWDRLDRARTGP